jgi:hypothetical protein
MTLFQSWFWPDRIAQWPKTGHPGLSWPEQRALPGIIEDRFHSFGQGPDKPQRDSEPK